MTIARKKIRKSGNQRLVQNSFVHEIWWLVKTCWNGLVTEWSKFHTWLIWVNPMLLTSKFGRKRLLLLSVFDRPICCYCQKDGVFGLLHCPYKFSRLNSYSLEKIHPWPTINLLMKICWCNYCIKCCIGSFIQELKLVKRKIHCLKGQMKQCNSSNETNNLSNIVQTCEWSGAQSLSMYVLYTNKQGRQDNCWAPGQKEAFPPPPPILQIMILKLIHHGVS